MTLAMIGNANGIVMEMAREVVLDVYREAA